MSLGVLVVVLLGLGTVTPSAARAQSLPADTVLDEARLTAYAKSYIAIAAARDQTHAELALPGNKTDQTQKELRDKLQKQIDQILREQSLTPEQYARITYVLSTDAQRRKSFEEILARLAPRRSER